jgi:hypothetical protein
LKLEAKINGREIDVTANLQPPAGKDLLIALVQRQAQSRVKAGENSGRKLAHVQIVRDFKKATEGHATLSLPVDYQQQQWEVTGFVQDRQTGVITDAARVRW